MSESVLISREHRPTAPPGTPGLVPPSSQRSRPGGGGAALAISCNRCRKPLNTTVFVCACDCTFCEECTYNHFNSSSNCPNCNKVLSEHDFMELVVADPSATTSSTRTSTFQSLFTKQNAASRALPFQDLCARVLKQQDDGRAGTKYLMKQFLVETKQQAQRFQQLYRAFEGLKQEHTSLKQSTNTQKVRYEKAIDSMQQQLASASKKLEEKDRQLYQFRKLHGSMTPESPSRGGGGDGARRVSTGSDSRHSQQQPAATMVPPGSRMQQPHPHHHQQQQPPPMQGFMIQKEAHERARQRALEAPHQRTPVLGHRNNHGGGGSGGRYPPSNPYATPRSSGSRGSQGSGSGAIRDLSSSSGYAFSSGGTGAPAAAADPNHTKRRRGMSPTQAFAMQPPGSYSVARGPSNYFQQGGGGGYSNSRR